MANRVGVLVGGAFEDGGRSGLGVEHAFPASDDDRGETVAGDVDHGSGHVHQGVDAQDDEDGLRREAKGGGGRQQNDQGGAGYTGDSLAGEDKGPHHQNLGADGEMDASGLGDEDARRGQVEGRPIEVEAVAGGDDEADDAAGNAEGLHALHCAGKCGFASGGCEGDGCGLGDGGEEAAHRDTKDQRGGEKDEQGEGDERGVEGQEQFGEVDHDAETHVANGKGHRRADANGREVHHDVGEAERHFAERLGEAQDGSAFRVREGSKGNAEEDGEDCDLEDLTFGDGLGEVFGKDVEEEIVPVESGGYGDGFCVRRDRQGEANSGMGEINCNEAYRQREGGNNFKIDKAANAHAANAFQVSMASDAGDESAEDEWGDDGLDEAKEDVGEDAEMDGEVGSVEADLGAGYHGGEDPRSNGAAADGEDREDQDGGPAKALTDYGQTRRGERDGYTGGEKN